MYYFAYGSNMSIEQMRERGCETAKLIGPSRLEGYRFVFSGSSPNWSMKGTANIIEDKGSEVWGALYEVDEDCLQKLDKFEHVPERRNRNIVRIIDNHDKPYDAVVYTLNDDLVENTPSDGYYNQVVTSAKDIGLPDEYLKTIEIKKDR